MSTLYGVLTRMYTALINADSLIGQGLSMTVNCAQDSLTMVTEEKPFLDMTMIEVIG